MEGVREVQETIEEERARAAERVQRLYEDGEELLGELNRGSITSDELTHGDLHALNFVSPCEAFDPYSSNNVLGCSEEDHYAA